jgi:Domain of unknown function (DUF4249)
MKKSFYPILFILVLLAAGCEKEADIQLKATDEVLVVDATIENDQPPIVYLSKSFNYFSKLSADLLAKSFVRNAKITISDGSRTVELKEYALPAGTNTVYVYSVDSSNLSQIMLGKLNTNYSMTILVNGKTYTANTRIPSIAKKLDSLWWKKAPDNPDTLKRIVYAKITDPPGLGNYVRYFTSINDSAFFPGFNSVFDDDVVDGTTYTVQVDKGVDRNTEVDFENAAFFKKGDTVEAKFCNIDKAHYDFWRTLEFSQQSIGNPFSQPGIVLGNISGGALGFFGGYAAQYKKLVIKD